jgi:hypothetical protein
MVKAQLSRYRRGNARCAPRAPMECFHGRSEALSEFRSIVKAQCKEEAHPPLGNCILLLHLIGEMANEWLQRAKANEQRQCQAPDRERFREGARMEALPRADGGSACLQGDITALPRQSPGGRKSKSAPAGAVERSPTSLANLIEISELFRAQQRLCVALRVVMHSGLKFPAGDPRKPAPGQATVQGR